MKNIAFSLLALGLAGLSMTAARAQVSSQDTAGCRDNPLFNRMPNFHNVDCSTASFDKRKFPVGPPLEDQRPKQVEVEGALTFMRFHLNEGSVPPGGLQVMRNFENFARNAGGMVLGTYPDWCTAKVDYDLRLGNNCASWGVSMRFISAGKEIWAYMQMIGDSSYGIQIVERRSMNQDVVGRGDLISHSVVIYEIFFDIGRSNLTSQSHAVLKEIAENMKHDISLKLSVRGGTDNVGKWAANMKLSRARAAAVVTALTGRYGIAADRLSSYFVGPYSPSASKETKEERAKNRMVQLVLE